MSNDLLPALVIEPKGIHQATVIWLHGLGADGYDFEPIATELDLPRELGVRFVLPHAPRRPVTINGGYVMRAWYDIAYTDLGKTPDLAGIRASAAAVMDWVEREIAGGIEPERIVLGGFSQGGVIALETASRHADRVAGAIGLSCYLGTPEEIPESAGNFPVFLAHGRQDPVVPFTAGIAARARLEKLGYAVEWREYALPHSVSLEEIQDIRDWLLGLWPAT
jgi:phospholipase/carboxylesterase